MTLRLTDAEAAALRAQAEVEGRSVHEVAGAAIRSYVGQSAHRRRVAASTADVVTRHAEALQRLGDA